MANTRLRSPILALNVVALLCGVASLGYGLYAVYRAALLAQLGALNTTYAILVGLFGGQAVGLTLAGLFGLCAGAMGLHAVGDAGVPSSWRASRGLHITSFVFAIFCIGFWAAFIALYRLYEKAIIGLSIATFVIEVGIPSRHHSRSGSQLISRNLSSRPRFQLTAIIFTGINFRAVESDLQALPIAAQQQQMVYVNVPQGAYPQAYPQAGYQQPVYQQPAYPQQQYQQPAYDPNGYQWPGQQQAPVYEVAK